MINEKLIPQIEEEVKEQEKLKKSSQEELKISKTNVSFYERQIRENDSAILILKETLSSLKGL